MNIGFAGEPNEVERVGWAVEVAVVQCGYEVEQLRVRLGEPYAIDVITVSLRMNWLRRLWWRTVSGQREALRIKTQARSVLSSLQDQPAVFAEFRIHPAP